MSANSEVRVLLIDDNPAIHEDFRKVLDGGSSTSRGLESARSAFLGQASEALAQAMEPERFQIDSAHQGEEGLALVQKALAEGRPYALAFVDVRMPPGWDGVKTIERIWQEDQDVQTVVCTAFSDYSWEEMGERVGRSDRLLILKKPFDAIEIRQLASSLTRKWTMIKRERNLIDELRRAEREARAYASSLETVNRALMTAKAAADKSSQIKTDFLVQLGNQIQTQMKNIFGRAELLKDPGELTASGLANLERILDGSRYLFSVFDDILDLTLIESGRVELDRVDFPLAQVVDEIVATYRRRAAEKNLVLRTNRRGPLPQRIRSDLERFKQVLQELLDNAVRYTDKGFVDLVMRLEQTEDWRQPILRLDVVDSGRGITAEHRGRIFEPFFRTTSSSEHRPGLGLGLSRQIAQLLGGDLVVETVPGRGSTFSFTLEAGDLEGVAMVE